MMEWTLLHQAISYVHPASLEVLVRAWQRRMDSTTLIQFVNREDHWGNGLTALTYFMVILNPTAGSLRGALPHTDENLLRMAQCLVPVGAAINVKVNKRFIPWNNLGRGTLSPIDFVG
jgi:hypothetical protein